MNKHSTQKLSESLTRSQSQAAQMRKHREQQEWQKRVNELTELWQNGLNTTLNDTEKTLNRLQAQSRRRSPSTWLLGVIFVVLVGNLGLMYWQDYHQRMEIQKLVLDRMGLELVTTRVGSYLIQLPGMTKPTVLEAPNYPNQWIIKIGD